MIFQVLAERTQKFEFDGIPNEPESASEDELRQLRLKDLIAKVIKMGIRKYYQSPVSCRVVHSKEDWIQKAMIIFIEQLEEYDPNRGKTFNKFILFRVKNRLTDRLRTFIKRDIQDTKNLPDPKEINKTKSPEDECIEKERREILWNCVSQLSPRELRMLFMRHEIEGISLQRLYDDIRMDYTIGNISLSSFETFKRHYRERIRGTVRDCVTNYFGGQGTRDGRHFQRRQG